MGQSRVVNKDMSPEQESTLRAVAGNWKQHAITQQIEVGRRGWLGAWDALKSAITRKPRLTIPQTVTLSVWLRYPEGTTPKLSIAQTQLETHQ